MQKQEVVLFLCMLTVLTIKINPTAIINVGKYNCSSSSYPPNSVFGKHLDNLLKSLPAHTNVTDKFYNTSVGHIEQVYGCFLCRREITPERCKGCVTNASATIKNSCPKSKVSILWYNECMVHYSDRNFFGVFENEPLLSECNGESIVRPEDLDRLLKKTVDALVAEAAKTGYAHREHNLEFGDHLHTLQAQCRNDLPQDKCQQCLQFVAEEFQRIQVGKIGGMVMLPGCFIRFVIYPFNDTGTRKLSLGTIITIVCAGAVFLWLSIFWVAKRYIVSRRMSRSSAETEISELESAQFHLATIRAATNDFSDENKLGEGGFGPVYKGELPNGQQIAAKRLAQNSEQGAVEFRNEIQLVAKLQHRNLVTPLGFTLEGDEMILVYEHMPNGSLDHILFEPELSKQLDWSTRHKIILGIARGLLYLHEDSRLTIIHRDIKASNILLDDEMNPKISDFGMARMFYAHQTKASTNRIAGTFGYMPPEYLMLGQFSMKSDVFSYGVLVLEIITGKKNNKFYSEEQDLDLISHVWKHWNSRTALDIVDPSMRNAYSVNEVIQCIHIGLLCVQVDTEERPTMDAVIVMLNVNDSSRLPLPGQPFLIFHGNKSLRRQSSAMSKQSSNSSTTLLS